MFGHQPKFWFYNVPWGKTTKTSMLKHKFRGLRCSSVIKHLPNMHKAWGLISSTIKTRSWAVAVAHSFNPCTQEVEARLILSLELVRAIQRDPI